MDRRNRNAQGRHRWRLLIMPLWRLALSVMCILLGGGVSAAGQENYGKSPEIPEDVRRLLSMSRDDHWDLRSSRLTDLCAVFENDVFCGEPHPAKTSVLIIGDSFGQDALNALSAGYPEANFITQFNGGCPLVPDLTGVRHSNEECSELNRLRFKAIETTLPEIDFVIVSIKITEDRLEGLKSTIDWMTDRHDKVIMLGVGPWIGRRDLGEIALEYGRLENIDEALQPHFVKRDFWIDDELEAHVTARNATYIRKLDYFCPAPDVYRVLTESGWPFTADRTHLTLGAAEDFGRYLAMTYPDLLTPD